MSSSELQVKLILKLPLLYNYEAGGWVADGRRLKPSSGKLNNLLAVFFRRFRK
jgi:hypothetical protein